MHTQKKVSGFTIVELLIVVVVIAILAAISMVAYTNIQSRARDSRRLSDITQIKNALLAYDVMYGGVVRPGVTGYTKPGDEPSMGGWDVSSSASWLIFLRNTNGLMPVDPINDASDPSSAVAGANRLYAYYCYDAGASAFPDSAAIVLRYRKDNGNYIAEKIAVTSCLTTIPA